MEKISVIVPIYNTDQTLNRCIWSIVNQTYRNLEILLIDDGSEDGSLDICREWEKKDLRIKVIHKKNEGLGYTRNLGIQVSTSDFIIFADADDWMEQTFVENLMKKLLSSEADFCLCDLVYWDSRTGEKSISKIRFDKDVVVPQDNLSVINKVRTFAWGKLWRKDLFSDAVMFPKWTFEDIAVVPILAYKAAKITYVNEPLYNYWRNQPDSLSMKSNHISDIQKSLHLLKKRGDSIKMSELAMLEIKKIMLGQVRFAYKRWYENESCRGALKRLTDSLTEYYECFRDYQNITFHKSWNEKINGGIRWVAYSEDQIQENGEIEINIPDRVIDGGELEIAEYIMERL